MAVCFALVGRAASWRQNIKNWVWFWMMVGDGDDDDADDEADADDAS